jgi:uncharacterized membrane protein YkvA (DUF1232 family)
MGVRGGVAALGEDADMVGLWRWVAIGAGAGLLLYLLFVLALLVGGRRQDARALAGFVPDCAVLFSRLLRDRRVARRHKLILGLLVAYLALPFDLVPDFIPVAGQLDDALLVALALRTVLRGSGRQLVQEHWPGPASSLAFVLRLAG